MIKAILFDMDGVLVDAKDWHFDCLNDALKQYGHEISMQDHLTRFDGLPTSTKLNILTEERGLDSKLHDKINGLKQKFTLEAFGERISPGKSQLQMLENLSKNHSLCLCSNSKSKTISTFLKSSQTGKYFDFYLSNEDVEIPKPDPEIYNKAISKFNLKPNECLIIEDNFNGIKAAKASGAFVLEIGKIAEVNYDNIIGKINQTHQGS